MLDGLIAGKLHGKPVERIGQSGKPFTTAKVLVPVADGEALFVSVIAFAETARAALMALDDGDSVSVSGPLSVKLWTDREGMPKPSLSIVAHAVLTAYHTTRKRRAMTADHADE